MGLKMPFGDDRILLEMGLKMPSKMFVENQENEHQNGIRIWNVSELYLEIEYV